MDQYMLIWKHTGLYSLLASSYKPYKVRKLRPEKLRQLIQCDCLATLGLLS